MPALRFDYKPTRLTLLNDGHTIQVNDDPGSTLTVAGQSFATTISYTTLPRTNTTRLPTPR